MIELNQVSYTYPDGCQALHQLDLSIAAGERVAVLGPNGAGKSTLFQLFNGLLLPSSGLVTVAGLSVCRANLPALRRQVGMVFQDADDQLFNATVYREVAYGPMNMGQRGETLDATVKWALEVVGMEDYLSRNPFNLSGGEKKRLSLACVLAMRPKVLVLDEPTNALDPKSAGMLVSLLKQINRDLGVTLLFATHDVDIVPLLADRVFLLDRGRMLLGGSPAEVFNQREVVRAIDLRLPRVAHLAEILMRDGLIPEGPLPLSIGQARALLHQVLATPDPAGDLTTRPFVSGTCQG